MTKKTVSASILSIINENLERLGVSLISLESKNHITYTCKCNSIVICNFRQIKARKYGCNNCASKAPKDLSKISKETVLSLFKERGFTLLSDYIGINDKLTYKCKCGNISSTSFSNFRSKKRGCVKCCNIGIKKEGKPKFTYEQVKQIFSDRGCILISTVYLKVTDKLEYICSCGNLAKTKFYIFNNGHKCIKCGGRERKTINFVKCYFAEHGCDLLEDSYINIKTPMKFKCSCQEISTITFACFKISKRCSPCGIKVRSGVHHTRYIKNREEAEWREKFRCKCQTLLKNTLLKLDINKKDHSYNLVGYTPYELKKHIESFPTWNELKNTDWHIDHIFPIAAFVDIGILDIKIINGLDNLQPLSQRDNLKKSCIYNKQDFIKWLNKKGINIEI